MEVKCPPIACRCGVARLETRHTVRNGSYRRVSDGRVVIRWKCQDCGLTFSRARLSPCYGQNKRRKNEPLRKLLCSGVSMRRSARLLNINRTTVERKLRFLAEQARIAQKKYLEGFKTRQVRQVQFDDMETFEHSKYKPLSITLAVTMERKILDAQVSQMPARGPLAKKGVEKYGKRRDLRSYGLKKLFTNLKPIVRADAIFESDQNPNYPIQLKRSFPKATHITTKGRKSSITGGGELKKTQWDPLFKLNHTAAMFRYCLSRLLRQTWCTTKDRHRLADHLAIYIHYHNQVLTN